METLKRLSRLLFNDERERAGGRGERAKDTVGTINLTSPDLLHVEFNDSACPSRLQTRNKAAIKFCVSITSLIRITGEGFEWLSFAVNNLSVIAMISHSPRTHGTKDQIFFSHVLRSRVFNNI